MSLGLSKLFFMYINQWWDIVEYHAMHLATALGLKQWSGFELRPF